MRETPLAALARERAIARYVLLGDFDNVLRHRHAQRGRRSAAARSDARAASPTRWSSSTEAFVDEDDLWLRDAHGARYCGEYIASIRSTARAQAPSTGAPASVDEAARTRTPASDWCYLKLYANDREFRSEIAPRLLQFAEEATTSGLATHWFYILYRDPDQHVRFRLRSAGDDAALRERALAFADELTRAGVVNRFALATYERELERYGGAEGIGLCERLFHLDSVAALRGPAVDVLNGRERIEAIAAPLLAFFDALTTEPSASATPTPAGPRRGAPHTTSPKALRALARQMPAADDARAHGARARARGECGGASRGSASSTACCTCTSTGAASRADEEGELRKLFWKVLFARRSRRSS